MDDESIKIIFQSFQTIPNHHICFSIKNIFQTFRICTDDEFPYIYYHVGSCKLSIEPEFIWILVEYDILIEKYKKGKLNQMK